jgi:hypothetical protein
VATGSLPTQRDDLEVGGMRDATPGGEAGDFRSSRLRVELLETALRFLGVRQCPFMQDVHIDPLAVMVAAVEGQPGLWVGVLSGGSIIESSAAGAASSTGILDEDLLLGIAAGAGSPVRARASAGERNEVDHRSR